MPVTMQLPRLTPRLGFSLILAAHLFLSLSYSLITPVWEAPDEIGHYLYVRHLQAYRTLPVQGPIFDAPRAHHPPGFYVLGALVSAGVNIPEPPDAVSFEINTKFPFRYGEAGIDNKMAYIHYRPEERFPYSGQALAVRLIRLLSVAFSVLAVWLVWLLARSLRPADAPFALLATGLVAFNPTVLFIGAVINNDSAGLAFSAGVLYLLSRFLRLGFTPRRWAVVGALWGLGLLFKTSLLILALPIGLAALYAAGQARRWQPLATAAFGVGIPAFIIAGWWHIRSHILYGDWTANKAIADFIGRVTPEERFSLLPQRLAEFGAGVVGRLGVGHGVFFLPGPIYWLFAGLAVLAAVWLVRQVWRTARPLGLRGVIRRRWSIEDWQWLTHVLVLGAVFGSVFVFMLTVYGGWIGRYMLPAFPSLACLLAAGLLGWLPGRWRWPASGGLVLAGAALAAYAGFGIMWPAYRPPPVPSAAALRAMTPLDANIGQTARVLGYTLDREVVSGGEMLAVTVYWEVLSQTDVQYTIFVHLLVPGAGSIAQRDTYPGLGNYPTMHWDPGRNFVDTYRLFLPDDAPATDDAQILLGLYSWPSMERLEVTGADAGPDDVRWVEFGRIAIR